MQLQQLETKKIFPNFAQPREHFDKEKIQELAESILGNGLINPITVRKDGDKYFIVAGERRWRAHQVAGLKKIDAFVKDYKSDFKFMVESSIENYQRVDVTAPEKENDIYNVWQQGLKDNEIKTYKDLAKIMGINDRHLATIIQAKQARDKLKIDASVSTRDINDTAKLNDDDRKKILKKKLPTEKLRETVRVVKKTSPEVRQALLNDEITIEQAERISKLKNEAARKKAIQEHKNLAVVSKNVERDVKRSESSKEKREFDKRLAQAGNWIESFRGSVTDSKRALEKTIKILLVATKFTPVMDDKQKEKLGIHLDRFIEILERGEQLSEQIKGGI